MAGVLPDSSSSLDAAVQPAPAQAQQQQRLSHNSGAGGRLDPDVATLSLTIDQHLQALTKDAVDHLLAVKARMAATLEAAVAEESEDGAKRLHGKQAEVDAVAAELKHTQLELGHTETVLDRVAGGYAGKQRAVHDRLNLLRSWYVWREWAQKKRRLQYLGVRLQQWYVRRWLLSRAWVRWLGQARLQYRTLVAERAEKQQKADAAALHAIHAQEAGGLRSQIESLQQQLQDEAEARNKMEEEMKRSFMRGVTAINLEALQIMRRGAPPSGANPFPVALPLNASTAASGLQAAAAAAAGVGGVGLLEQQQQQVDAAVTAPGEGSVMLSAPGTAAGTPPHNTWAQQPGGVLYSQIGDAAAAQSVYGAAAVVQLQPQARPQQQGVGSPMSGPRVYVERGPASKGSPIATSSPAHLKGSPQQQAQQGQQRSVGVRRALHHSQPGK